MAITLNTNLFPFSFLHSDGDRKTIMVRFDDADVIRAVQSATDEIKNNPQVIPVFHSGSCLATFLNGSGKSGPIQVKIAFNNSDENSIYIHIEYEEIVARHCIRLSVIYFDLKDRQWYGLIPPGITEVLRKLVRYRKSDHVVKCLQQA